MALDISNFNDIYILWNSILKERSENGSFNGLMELYRFVRDNESLIKEKLLNTLTIPKLQRITGRDGKKDSQIKMAYDRIFDLFLFSRDSVSYNPFGGEAYISAVKKVIESQTEKEFESFLNDKKEHLIKNEKSLTNPETLEEYRTFLSSKKLADLTDIQLGQYDQLVAEAVEKYTEREAERKHVITSVNLGDIDFVYKETIHTQKQTPLYVVQLTGRVEKDVYNDLNGKAKKLGGYYSSFTKGGAIPGFQFKEKSSADKFMLLKESNIDNKEESEKRKLAKDVNRSESLKEKADRLILEGNQQLSQERKANTNRRARFAASAEERAQTKLKFGLILSTIADGITDGSIKFLKNVSSITDIQTLYQILNRARWDKIRVENLKSDSVGFDDAIIRYVKYPFPIINVGNLKNDLNSVENISGFKRGAASLLKRVKHIKDEDSSVVFNTEYGIDELRILTESHEPEYSRYRAENYKNTILNYDRIKRLRLEKVEQLRMALRELLKISKGEILTPEQKAELQIKEIEREFIGKKIEGFFPTPLELSEEVVDRADIKPEDDILEPSAGLGHIAEVIRLKYPDNKLQVVEYNSSLAEALKKKGFNVDHEDFLKVTGSYDRIIMNPPFENNQDIDHVYHAYSLLKEGGRIVAIMAGNKQGASKKIKEFRDFLENKGEIIENPEGSFKSSFNPTGVNTVTVVIDKPIDTQNGTKEIPERLPQETSGSVNELQKEDEVANYIRTSVAAAGAEQQRSRQELEKIASLEYAKTHNVWITDLYSLGDPMPGGGNENTLAYNIRDGFVYKANNLINHNDSILLLFDSIKYHNEIFECDKYYFIGFTGIDNGEKTPYIQPIFKQQYVQDAVQATFEEIDEFMKGMGFEKVNEHTFKNDKYIVSDLRPRNVFKDEEGNFCVIDDIVKLNDMKTKEQEYLEMGVSELVDLKKKLYENIGIEQPISEDEKLLNKIIAEKYSDINEKIKQKRSEVHSEENAQTEIGTTSQETENSNSATDVRSAEEEKQIAINTDTEILAIESEAKEILSYEFKIDSKSKEGSLLFKSQQLIEKILTIITTLSLSKPQISKLINILYSIQDKLAGKNKQSELLELLNIPNVNVWEFIPKNLYVMPKYKPYSLSPNDKTLKSILSDFTLDKSHSWMRKSLLGAYFHKDYVAASDGHILLKIKGPTEEQGKYCLTKHCIDNEKEFKDENEPDFNVVIPERYEERHYTSLIDLASFAESCTGAYLVNSNTNAIVVKYGNDKDGNPLFLGINAEYLIITINAISKLSPQEKFDLGFSGKGRAITIRNIDSSVIALIMPIIIDDIPHSLYFDIETGMVVQNNISVGVGQNYIPEPVIESPVVERITPIVQTVLDAPYIPEPETAFVASELAEPDEVQQAIDLLSDLLPDPEAQEAIDLLKDLQ